MKKLLLYTFLLTLTIWSYAQYPQIDKQIVFAEYFTSDGDIALNGGVKTDVSVAYGSGTFNGTSSKVNYDLNLNGVYSVRIRCNPTSFAEDKVLFDLRGSAINGLGVIYLKITTGDLSIIGSGTKYVNGIATSSITVGVSNEIIVTGITLKQGTGINKSLIGSSYINTNEFLGTIDYLEIWEGTLSAEEVSLLYDGKYYRPFPDMVQDDNLQLLSKVTSHSGVISDLYNTVTNTSVDLVQLGNSEVMEFNGSTSKIDLGSDFIGTGDVTFCGWVYAKSYGETTGHIIDNGKTQIRVVGLNSNYSITSDGQSTKIYSAVNSLFLNKWQFICVTREADGTANFYIGGLGKDEQPTLSGSANQNSGVPQAGLTSVIIGNNAAQTNTFDGYIKTPTTYRGIMSTTQITNLWSYSKQFIK